jgi:hypothetical protein
VVVVRRNIFSASCIRELEKFCPWTKQFPTLHHLLCHTSSCVQCHAIGLRFDMFGRFQVRMTCSAFQTCIFPSLMPKFVPHPHTPSFTLAEVPNSYVG